jgi:16S rRNA (guanine966-N2)-methyltransferase
MRIVGGTLSGRKIEPPLSLVTRPMMDRVREALFNVLAHRDWGKNIGDLFESDVHVLDAFCGTGALAFEAISWGAGQATLFDKDPQALKIAQQNAATLGIANQCLIVPADSTNPPKPEFANQPSRKNDKIPLPLREGLEPAPHLMRGEGCINGFSSNRPNACKLIFLAPPYRKSLIPPSFAALDAAGWIAPHAVIVAETAKKEPFSPMSGCELVLDRAYGDTALHFLKR